MAQRRLHRGSPDRQLCALPRYRKAVRTLGYGQARHRSIGPLSPKPTVRALDADAITLLMKRGEQLVEAGDFAAARTLFQRAAEADEAAAATIRPYLPGCVSSGSMRTWVRRVSGIRRLSALDLPTPSDVWNCWQTDRHTDVGARALSDEQTEAHASKRMRHSRQKGRPALLLRQCVALRIRWSD
jgi:hypothetical protein